MGLESPLDPKVTSSGLQKALLKPSSSGWLGRAHLGHDPEPGDTQIDQLNWALPEIVDVAAEEGLSLIQACYARFQASFGTPTGSESARNTSPKSPSEQRPLS